MVDWGEAQRALRDEVARAVGLIRSMRNPGAHAVGQWNAGDVAMHLSQAFIVVPGLARNDLSAAHELLPSTARHGESLLGDVWELGDVTTLGVKSDPERDPRVLADRIEERAAAFLDGLAGHTADEPRPWLVEGTVVNLPTLTCHLLNETIMHGGDIARAEKQPWPVERAHAALVLDGFVWAVIQAMGPTNMVDKKAAAGVHATYELKIRGGLTYRFEFADGELTIGPPDGRRVDCHISADPVALLQVAYARESQWTAIAKGQLVAWGRKPWLGPRFRALLRNP